MVVSHTRVQRQLLSVKVLTTASDAAPLMVMSDRVATIF